MAARLLVCLTLVASAFGAELTILEEGSPAHFTGLGNEALVDGRYEIAASLYRRALEQDPHYVTARFNLGVSCQYVSDLSGAKTAYEAVLSVRGDHAPALANLAWLAWQFGDLETAASRYADAARYAQSNPIEQADYLFSLGAVRDAQKRPSDSRRAYEQALKASPKHVGAQYNLATLLLSGEPTAGMVAQAHELLHQVVTNEPSNVDAWVNLSLCLERQDKPDGAKAALDRAVLEAKGAQKARILWRRAQWNERQVPTRRVAMRDDLQDCLAIDLDFPDANAKLGTYLFAIGEYEKSAAYLEREVLGANDIHSLADREAHFILAEIYTDHLPDAAKALMHATHAQSSDSDPRMRELHRRVEVLLHPTRGNSPASETTPPASVAPTPEY